MSKINWGILGCGDVTEIKSGPAFNKVPNSAIEAVMRRDAAKAADYAKRHHIKKWYSHADELINDPNINAIYIATPPAPHKGYAIQALKAGKNVYIEKPVTLNTQECQEIINARKTYGGKVTVAHYRRALPLFMKVKELIDIHAIGDVRLIDLKLWQKPGSDQIAKTDENWRINPAISGGGLFYDLAPHQLDILVQVFGTPILIQGFSRNQSGQNRAADLTVGQLLFPKDIAFTGSWCFNSHPANEIEQCHIVGSKGSISFPFFGNTLALAIEGKTEQLSFKNPDHVQQNLIEQTVNHFLGEAENPCSLEDALISLNMMECFSK